MSEIRLTHNDKSIKLSTSPLNITLKHTTAPVTGGGVTDYNNLTNKPDLSIYATKIDVDTSLAGKANVVHVHTISDVSGLQAALDLKADEATLATVATTGSYNDLLNKPTPVDISGKADKTYVDSQDALKADKTTTYTKTEVDNKVASLVDAAPATLDTLNELATALGNDPNFATTVSTQIGNKADTTALTAHTSNTSNPHSVTKAQVGLGNVSNLAPADMPVSTATQTAINAKANDSAVVKLTGNQTIADVKTFSSSPIVPTATTNTQAVNKQQMDTADALKVNKAGDTMTGQLNAPSLGVGSGRLFISATAPSSPITGDLWVDLS